VPSIYSPTGRRAALSSLNTDKPLADLKPPTLISTHVPSKAQNTDIQKKKATPLEQLQRLEQQNGLDQLELKVAKSAGKLKTMNERKNE